MQVYRLIEKAFLACLSFMWVLFIKIHEYKNIKKKKNIYASDSLTDAQKAQIDEFYKKNYGKKISHHWHRLYKSYSGNFDYKYLPDFIYTTQLELLGNKRMDVLPIENKVVLSNFVRGEEDLVRTPETYIACVKGMYFDGNKNVIDKKSVLEKLSVLNGGAYKAIVKKTVDTSSGRDVRLIDVENGIDRIENEHIQSIIDSMGSDFIIQEKIEAHAAFAALYSGSVNTIRVVSYRTSSAIKVAPIIMRIGQNGYVDNAHAGGMFIGITENGELLGKAYSEYGKNYIKHPVSGVTFDGYVLPRIPEVIEAAVKMHSHYPTMRFISWDFTIDKDERIVLIEANLHSQTVWMSQIAHGKAFFGEDTAEMLQLVRK